MKRKIELLIIACVLLECISLLWLAPSDAQTTQPMTYEQQFGSVGAQIDATIAAYKAQLATFQTQFVASGSDLATLAGSTKRYGIPGVSYAWNNTAASAFAGGGFLGQVNTIALKPVAGGSTGISIRGDGVEFSGATLDGNCNGFRIWGIDPAIHHVPVVGDYLHDLNFGATLQTGVLLDTWADNVTISHCRFSVTNAQGIYCTADNLTVEDCSFAGSVGEHDARWDRNSTTGHRPANARIINCSFSNPLPGSPTINRTGKEALTFREVDGATITNCTFNGWVSIGQAPTDPGWHARHVTFIDCVWTASRPGGALLNVRHDADVRCIRCTFPASNTDSPVTGDANSYVRLTDCSLSGATPASKPIAAAIDPSATVIVETTPAPATQPATRPTR